MIIPNTISQLYQLERDGVAERVGSAKTADRRVLAVVFWCCTEQLLHYIAVHIHQLGGFGAGDRLYNLVLKDGVALWLCPDGEVRQGKRVPRGCQVLFWSRLVKGFFFGRASVRLG